jgi:hypothetical protein
VTLKSYAAGERSKDQISRDFCGGSIFDFFNSIRQKRSVACTFLGEPDCSVDINDTLAIERRRGRGGGGPSYACTWCRPRSTTSGTKVCSSVRRKLSSRSTFGPFEFAWKSRDQGATLQSSTWRSTASFALATWSNCAWTTFAREPMCGIEHNRTV